MLALTTAMEVAGTLYHIRALNGLRFTSSLLAAHKGQVFRVNMMVARQDLCFCLLAAATYYSLAEVNDAL